MVLLVDQLDELFTRPDIAASDRAVFARILVGLSRSGAVWVIATMRSDLWHRTAELPDLRGLAGGEGGARILHLLPPDTSELFEMIRRPAVAAGLTFETAPETGLGLDDLTG